MADQTADSSAHPAAEPSRIPLRVDEVWSRLRVAEVGRTPGEIIGSSTVRQVVLEEFRPLTSSLEWDLSRLHWARSGTLPFAENEVPFLVNNSGRLAEDAVAVLFANCCEASPDERIVVLELGAGCGLMARAFLAAFRALCTSSGRDFFERLTYLVTDASPRTVEDWATRGLFSGFESHVLPLVLNADDPRQLQELGARAQLGASRIRAVFCNYVLDVLRSRVVRRSGDALLELHVRTLLSVEPALLREYTPHSVEELQRFAASQDSAERAHLISLTSLFDVEASFLPAEGEASHLDAALACAVDAPAVLVNTSALDCMDALRDVVSPQGFVLINDYGPTDLQQGVQYGASQRFGRTTAQSINFPVFDALVGRSWSVVTPHADQERSIHSRLLVREDLAQTRAAFHDRFSAAAQGSFEEPLTQAREHIATGRRNEALAAFRLAIEKAPRDWRVLGEAAEFVGLELRDFASGAELARSALELNPWYSTWLWNVLGDCLYCQERFADAHESYLQAQRIHPRDPRTLLNIAYTRAWAGDHAEALRAIGLALACDAGPFRERLIEKQAAIVASMDLRRSGEAKRAALAASRLHLKP